MLSRNPAKADSYREVMKMESHCAERRGTAIWCMHENCVVKPLKVANLITQDDAQLIQKYCGIMDVNAFEVRSETFEVYWYMLLLMATLCCFIDQRFERKLFLTLNSILCVCVGIAHSWTLSESGFTIT